MEKVINLGIKRPHLLMRTVSSKMSGWIRYSLAMDKKPADLTFIKKQKQSEAEELTDCKKSCNDTENAASLNRVIHLKNLHTVKLL